MTANDRVSYKRRKAEESKNPKIIFLLLLTGQSNLNSVIFNSQPEPKALTEMQ